jgi:hypothetical protein
MKIFILTLPVFAAWIIYIGVGKVARLFGNMLIITALVFVSGLVTYTPDWVGYVYWFENDAGRDFIFRAFASFYSNFENFHLTHVFVHASLLTLLLSKLSGRISGFLIVIYVSTIYLVYTTQIRFFVGYFALCYSFYLFYVERLVLKSILLLIFSVANHISMFAMLPLFFIIYLTQGSLRKFIKMSCVLGVVIYIAFAYVDPAKYMDSYLNAYVASGDAGPTFIGGVFNFGLYLTSSVLLIFVNFNSAQKIQLNTVDYKKFDLVLKMAIGSMIFLPIAFSSQTFGNRFIVPALIFHMIAWVEYLRNIIAEKIIRIFFISSIWLILLFYTYFLPKIIGIESMLERSIEVFESNILFR